MLSATCPVEYCGHPLLFSAAAVIVQCHRCSSGPISIYQLSDMVESSDTQVQYEWIRRKASVEAMDGRLGPGPVQLANRSIDGIGGYMDCKVLWPYFEVCGVTNGGEVKKLSEMGRSEPINVATFGDYAFAMTEEDKVVAGYGPDHASIRYSSKLIEAVASANDRQSNQWLILVPLVARFASDAVSIACFGREVFARRICQAMLHHLKTRADEYLKRLSPERVVPSGALSAVLETAPSLSYDIELAATANTLFRPVIMLSAEPPFVLNVFLPFLRNPDDCRDQNGAKRSPLLFGWSDGTRRAYVAYVSMAVANGKTSNIEPVLLPRKWLRPVWGAPDQSQADQMLTTYLDFDVDDRCLVASGKYFKPEYLRRIVTAFQRSALDKAGIDTRLVADYIVDYRPSTSEDVPAILMEASVNENLYRCVSCQRVVLEPVPACESCPFCEVEGRLRRLRLDDTVEYADGDHTETAAPNSWCYTKRKHWHNGVEYDNPPIRIDAPLRMQSSTVHEHVHWFTDESDTNLNTTMDQVAALVATRYQTAGVSVEKLVKEAEAKIAEKLSDAKFLLQQRIAHLRESLGDTGYEALFDDWQAAADAMGPTSLRDDTSKDSVDAFLERVCECSRDYRRTVIRPMADMTKNEAAKSTKALDRAHAVKARIDKNMFAFLENTTRGWIQQELWSVVCSKQDLFQMGGPYFLLAVSQYHGKRTHFPLPLMGLLQFAFSDDLDSLVVCLPSGHYDVKSSLDLILALDTDDPGVFTKIVCDHVPMVCSAYVQCA